MDEKPYKIVLAGKHRVGKTSIFRALQNFGERSRSSDGGMYTIETGTGISSRQAREKWMVHMLVRNSEVTVGPISLLRHRSRSMIVLFIYLQNKGVG